MFVANVNQGVQVFESSIQDISHLQQPSLDMLLPKKLDFLVSQVRMHLYIPARTIYTLKI